METIKQEIKKMVELLSTANTVNEYDLIIRNNTLKINKALSAMQGLYNKQEIDEICDFYINMKNKYSYIRAELFKKEREQTILDMLRE